MRGSFVIQEFQTFGWDKTENPPRHVLLGG
jgi:hypothetical protein